MTIKRHLHIIYKKQPDLIPKEKQDTPLENADVKPDKTIIAADTVLKEKEVIEVLKKIPDEQLDEIVEAVKETRSKDDVKDDNNKEAPLPPSEDVRQPPHKEKDIGGLINKVPEVNDKRANVLAAAAAASWSMGA